MLVLDTEKKRKEKKTTNDVAFDTRNEPFFPSKQLSYVVD
jgi:hypothetical protein